MPLPDLRSIRRHSARRRVRLVGWGPWLACAAVFAASACREKQPSDRATELHETERAVKRGTRVVVETTAGLFLEATVLREFPEHLGLQTADGSRSLKVSRTDVYSLSQPKLEGHALEYAICSLRRASWTGCQLLEVQGSRARVLAPDLTEHHIEKNRVLAGTPLTRMNVEHSFDKSRRRQRFAEDLKRAGSPARPAGWRPGARERVVARRQGDWYEARVHELEEDGVRVRWQGSGLIEPVGSQDIAPLPPYHVILKRDDFALMRPRAESDPWVYVRIRGSAAEYKVEDVKGELMQVHETALIPLAPNGGELPEFDR